MFVKKGEVEKVNFRMMSFSGSKLVQKQLYYQ